MWVSFTAKSGNRKIGSIPVSTTEEKSCPSTCPLKGTDCYARFGPLGMHWRKVKEGQRGDNWDGFCGRIKKLPTGQLWRHNQAGDLPHAEGKIDRKKLSLLVRANKGLRGWTYTHHNPSIKTNATAIKRANANGFTINLSANNVREAEEYYSLGIAPVVTILPEGSPTRGARTPSGIPIVVCPAQTVDSMTCEQCRLCQCSTRKSIVGFLAHGTASKRLSSSLQ